MNKYSGALARRYGTALYDILVSATNSKQEFEVRVQQVRMINSFWNKSIANNFLLASLGQNEKYEILESFLKGIFKTDAVFPEIISFLKVVIENKRLLELKPIFNFFLNKADDYLGIARTTVISARPLNDQDAKEFETSLEQALKKKIIIKTEVDESLKSGYVVQIGNVNVDASLKARLNNLKELFI